MTRKKSTATRQAEQAAAAERAARVRQEQERAERRRRTLIIGGAVAVVLTLLLGIGYAVQSGRDDTGQDAAVPAGAVDTYAVPRGDAAAPITVEVYEDFMCPFCGDFEEASGPLLDGYVEDGTVQVQYRPVAWLDRFSEGSEYSTRALNALAVVLDTAGPDAAARMHDLLFAEQPAEGTEGLDDATLVDLAVEAGADRDAVTAPIEDRAFEGWVRNASDQASQDGVAQTPTVLVDGARVEGDTIEDLVAGLEEAVEGAS